MINYLFIALFSIGCLASIDNKSVNPKYKIHDLYGLFEDYSQVGNDVLVKSFVYEDSNWGGIYKHLKNDQKIDLIEFYKMQELGQRVFRAKASDQENSQGSAFYVGGRYILTNHHVYSPTYRKNLSCGTFSITTNSSLENVELYCNKVVRCNEDLDYCLIEMKDKVKKKFLSSEVIKTWSITSLKTINLAKEVEFGSDVITRVIGNPQFRGIHTSKGIGLRKYQGKFMFFAPVFSGNSGGPLLNDDGKLIGVVRSQSPKLLSESSYNFAIPINSILLDLKNNVSKEITNQLFK